MLLIDSSRRCYKPEKPAELLFNAQVFAKCCVQKVFYLCCMAVVCLHIFSAKNSVEELRQIFLQLKDEVFANPKFTTQKR